MLFEEKHSKSNYFVTLQYEDIICIPHCQNSFEILFVTKGSVDAIFNDRVITVTEGHCIWVLPYEIHHYITQGTSSVFIAIFSPDYVSEFYDNIKSKRLNNPVLCFENQIYALKSNNIYLIKSALYELCADAEKQGIKEKSDFKMNDTASKIMLYIQEHYREQIALKDLAEHLGYSYSHTSAIMSKCFESSFSDIINEYRLNYTKMLLKEGTHSITEIAELSGFSTIRNFNTAFKKAFGISPSEYKGKERFCTGERDGVK